MTILYIETSTNVCSIAVSNNGDCIFKLSDDKGLNHASLLSQFIQEAFIFIEKNTLKLDAVAVSGGPGSYTGLRIGVSTAKGLCYGLDIPLIAIDTLEVLNYGLKAVHLIEENTLLCPMIDARRMEVYTALYDSSTLKTVEEITAKIIDEQSFAEYIEEKTIYFFGNGSDKCQTILTHKNGHFVGGIVPLAENMISLGETKFRNKDFVDVAYYEPFYLKEFQTTIPKLKSVVTE